MPRISPARSCSGQAESVGRSLRTGRRAGFTLMEALVALVILGITVTVLVRVHIGTLRARGMARGIDETVTQLGNVAALSFLGRDDREIIDSAARDGWTAMVEGRNGPEAGEMWKVWTVASSNQPAPPLKMYLRDRRWTGTAHPREGQNAEGQ